MKLIGPLRAALVFSSTVASAQLADDAEILPPSQIKTLMNQCSREVPKSGESGRTPTESDIAPLEAALPKALSNYRRMGWPDWAHAPEGWRRQYVGYIRGGRRYVYGSFDPHPSREQHKNEHWRLAVADSGICDGGPNWFGVEYYPAAHRFTHIAFNGLG